jgi:hypothetical protein
MTMLIMEIARLKDSDMWIKVANPSERDLSMSAYWLSNGFCEYVEVSNGGGTISRFIRKTDFRKYTK